MKNLGKFIPLSVLVPSMENLPRLYFLYRNAAESGDKGARLRFQHFRKQQPETLLRQIEEAFMRPSTDGPTEPGKAAPKARSPRRPR